MQKLLYCSTQTIFSDSPCSVLGFHDLCDETQSWINEKDQTLSTEDCGRDLSSVQALQRRHQVSVATGGHKWLCDTKFSPRKLHRVIRDWLFISV